MAIVGTCYPEHIDDALAASEIELDPEVLRRIDEIMADAAPVSGPSPETP